MNEQRYTPGPWTYEDSAHIYDSEGYPIALMLMDSPRNNRDLNAALIAAAPNLLQALQALLVRASALDQSATHDGLLNCDALRQARAAISKATDTYPLPALSKAKGG